MKMPELKTLLRVGVALLCLQHKAFAQVVLEHDGVSVSKGELEYLVSQWPDQMKQAASNDEGDRIELLNRVFIAKKIAAEADKIPEGSEAYWRLSNTIMNDKRKFVLTEYARNLEVPDMSALAEERYHSEKEKYARVPERRLSSHILFACAPGGGCSRAEAEKKAEKVLEELRAGAEFEAMVAEYSGDPGSKNKGGKFNKWMQEGEVGVVGPYSQGVFSIEKVGEYSDVVSTRFGYHIIRLDGIEEEHYKPYEEVKAQITADLEREYRTSSLKDFSRSFNMTEDAFIDTEAVDEIFAPYKKVDAE